MTPEEKALAFLGLIILGCLIGWAMYEIGKDGYNEGYKDGQVDAINGDIWYELQTNEDGETVFEELEEPKKSTT